MRIGFLTASSSRMAGGLFPIVSSLAHELSRLNSIDLIVWTLRDDFTDADSSAWDGVQLTACEVKGPRAFGYARELRARLEAEDLDLVHNHGIWMYPSVASLQWARKFGRPYVVSPQGMLDPWALHNSRWKKRLAGWIYQDSQLRRAACIHVVCEAEARAIRACGLRNPVCVIPNGVDLPEEARNADSPPVSTLGHWGQSPGGAGANVLLFLGRLHPKKGLPDLLRGWKLGREHSKGLREWELVIAGWDQGGHREELERLCREQGIEGVRFVGPQFGAEKAAAFQRAAAFILPSLSEGLPMAVLEAWSYRLPVVMTPECNLPEGFQAGAAMRVETEPGSIARGLTELVEMSDVQRREMGWRGRRLVEERFSWPKIARQMKSIYEWVLGGGPKPDCVIQ